MQNTTMMLNRFRYSIWNAGSSVADGEDGSPGRKERRMFSFRGRSMRRSKNTNRKRPLADCSDEVMTLNDEEDHASFRFSPLEEESHEPFREIPPLSSPCKRKEGLIVPIGDTNHRYPCKRQKTESTSKQLPFFTFSNDEKTPPLCPFSFSKPTTPTADRCSSPWDRFQSILDRPFEYWQPVNAILKEAFPTWTDYQRGRMIHHLIHFLELKIVKDEYVPRGLLLPTPVVGLAWRALVMEQHVYAKITHALQDFHLKPRGMIHYTFVSHQSLSSKESDEVIKHTQSLFLVYFKEIMPSTITDESREPLSWPPPFCARHQEKSHIITNPHQHCSVPRHDNLSMLSKAMENTFLSPDNGSDHSSLMDDGTVATEATTSVSDSVLMGLGFVDEI